MRWMSRWQGSFLALSDLETERFVMDKKNGKYSLDLWEANRQIMVRAGMRPENITVTDLCTRCNHDWLISHRNRRKTGRYGGDDVFGGAVQPGGGKSMTELMQACRICPRSCGAEGKERADKAFAAWVYFPG